MKKHRVELVGQRVKVVQCLAETHDDTLSWCVCSLVGTTVTILDKANRVYFGEPRYHVEGSDKRVRSTEVRIIQRKAKKVLLKLEKGK